MKTVICQSYRTQNVPDWIAACLGSVRQWAAARGYDYRFMDDEFLGLVPKWYSQQAGGNLYLVSDLARLLFARDLLAEGYDRAIWVDADALIFEPNVFDVTVTHGYAFTREVLLFDDPRAFGTDRVENAGTFAVTLNFRVNNSVAVFARGNTLLPFYIDACLSMVGCMNPMYRNEMALGAPWLTMLSQALAFPLLDGVAHFSPLVMQEIAEGPGKLVQLLRGLYDTPIYAANLNASAGERGFTEAGVYERVVDRLLSTRGGLLSNQDRSAVLA